MLGRKDYTKQEVQHGRDTIQRQLAAYRKLAKSIAAGAGAQKAQLALEEFEPLFFNNMVLVLDRFYVHRLRVTAGKDGNPLNEVELIADSLMNNDGVLRGNNVVKYDPEKSVVKLKIGDKIRLIEKDFERLASAFSDELEKRFVK
jgi:hypothetical protein